MFYLGIPIIMNVLCMVFTSSCATKKPIRQLDLTVHIQYFLKHPEVLTNHKTISVYYRNDMTMYKFGNLFDTLVNNVLVGEGYRYSYFVHKKGERRGYKFHPADGSVNGRFPVDSVLKNLVLGEFSWEQLAALQPITSFDEKSKVLKEIYTGGEMESDTVILHFGNRFKDYEFSLSKKLDSLKSMKLFRIDVRNSPIYEDSLKVSWPGRNSYFLLEEGRDGDLSQVAHYFDEYVRLENGGM